MQPLPVLHDWLTGYISNYREGYQMATFCRKCQSETEHYANGNCKECAKITGAAFYLRNRKAIRKRHSIWATENKDKRKAYSAALPEKSKEKIRIRGIHYRALNIDKIKEKNKKYGELNKDKIKKYSVEYYQKNKAKIKAYSEKWRKENIEKVRATAAAWRKANPGISTVKWHNRQARKKANGGVLSKGLSAKLFKLQKGKCACCGLPLGDKYHMDHIMPIYLGGSNSDDNIQLLRGSCNDQKSVKHPVDFMQSKGFLL